MGPLELIALEFPGNRFSGEILPALQAVVDKGIVRIIDLAFVKKDGDGAVTALELQDLPGEEARVFDPVAADVAGLLSAADVARVADGLRANSSAAVLLFEHTWVSDVRGAVLRANGRVLLSERIPADLAEAAAAAAAADAAAAQRDEIAAVAAGA
jgi:hypothetical protein